MKRNTTVRDRHRRTLAKGHPPCYLCGEEIDWHPASHLDPLAFVVDHIVPLHKGGPDTLDNCRPAHRRCNRAKGDRIGPLTARPGTLFVTTRTW